MPYAVLMPVRIATLDDAEAIARVQVASWHAAYRELIPASRLATFTVPHRALAWRRSLRERGALRTTVFEVGEVVGFAAIGRSRDLAGWGEIRELYVAPDAWGRGVGSALFADAIAWLCARSLPSVMLWMLEGNSRALQFYQGSGFALDGARKTEDGYRQVRLRRPR